MREEHRGNDLGSHSPHGSEKNNLAKTRVIVMHADPDFSLEPKKQWRGGGNQQKVGEPSAQGRKIEGPTIQHIDHDPNEAQWVECVAESFQKRAVIKIPAPSASDALMKIKPMLQRVADSSGVRQTPHPALRLIDSD